VDLKLLHLDFADKLFIMYLYVCICVWFLIRIYNSDKKKEESRAKEETKKPKNYIQTNYFVYIKIWINGIEKLITDDNHEYKGEENRSILPRKYEINCSKINFIRAVINWCKINLDGNNKREINLIIKYKAHKRLMGEYRYYTKTIIIYFGSHNSIEALVDTVIHEFSHAQNITSKKHQAEYDKLTKDEGYYNNPHEILARKIANENKMKCIIDLIKQNYLK
jgi:hypothetical protein